MFKIIVKMKQITTGSTYSCQKNLYTFLSAGRAVKRTGRMFVETVHFAPHPDFSFPYFPFKVFSTSCFCIFHFGDWTFCKIFTGSSSSFVLLFLFWDCFSVCFSFSPFTFVEHLSNLFFALDNVEVFTQCSTLTFPFLLHFTQLCTKLFFTWFISAS